MPDYRKKHVNHLKRAPKPKTEKLKNFEEDDDIEFVKSDKKQKTAKAPKSNMKVLKGRKLEQRRKTKILLTVVSVIIATCVILELTLPCGIIENAENLAAQIGSGSYPTDLTGNDVLNIQQRNGYYYVLTDMTLTAHTNAGKDIYSYAHGFDSPILKTSATRALLFSQGKTEAVIFTLQSQKSAITTKTEIITANISDSGVYAIVTRSDSYASVVSVYDKKDKLIYEWFSSADMVNNVAVSPNGKKIAISLFNATTGKYNSSIKVLTFEDASAKYTENYDGKLVYDINTVQKSGFSVITENEIRFIKWSDYTVQSYKNDYNISAFRSASGGSVAVFNRESNKTDNRIAVFNKRGELRSEFEFKGIISDITISGGHIYCISDTSAFILSEKGEVIKKTECGFGVKRLSVIETDIIAALTDNKIEKIIFS